MILGLKSLLVQRGDLRSSLIAFLLQAIVRHDRNLKVSLTIVLIPSAFPGAQVWTEQFKNGYSVQLIYNCYTFILRSSLKVALLSWYYHISLPLDALHFVLRNCVSLPHPLQIMHPLLLQYGIWLLNFTGTTWILPVM